MSAPTADKFAREIVEQLMRLREADALPLVESAPGRGVWRYAFRAAGQPVSIDLDATVLSLRCYHGRDEVAMSPVPPATVEMLLGRRPIPAGRAKTTEAEAVAALRRIVAAWREGNPRIYMTPPGTVGHADNWNRA
jgi:hypothetical protein